MQHPPGAIPMTTTTSHRLLLLLAAACGVVPLAATPVKAKPPQPALEHIDRTLTKQPKYFAKPKYSLLLLGADKVKVWMVEDGKRLFVDKNANGDLTDDGAPLEPKDERKFADHWGTIPSSRGRRPARNWKRSATQPWRPYERRPPRRKTPKFASGRHASSKRSPRAVERDGYGCGRVARPTAGISSMAVNDALWKVH